MTLPDPPPPPPRPDPLTGDTSMFRTPRKVGQTYEKKEWVVISRFALWLCGTVTFIAGLALGFSLAIILVLAGVR